MTERLAPPRSRSWDDLRHELDDLAGLGVGLHAAAERLGMDIDWLRTRMTRAGYEYGRKTA